MLVVVPAACRRGDLQILSYCMVQWLCGRLPWEDKLQDPVYVRDSKIRYGAPGSAADQLENIVSGFCAWTRQTEEIIRELLTPIMVANNDK